MCGDSRAYGRIGSHGCGMVDLTSTPLWGGWVHRRGRAPPGLSLMIVGDARVADRAGGNPPAACPGFTTTSCTLHVALPPLVAVRAQTDSEPLESAAVTRHI